MFMHKRACVCALWTPVVKRLLEYVEQRPPPCGCHTRTLTLTLCVHTLIRIMHVSA